MSTTRASACHYCPGWLTGLWLALGIMVLLLVGACHLSTPVVDRVEPARASDAITGPRARPQSAPSLAAPSRISRPKGPAYRVDNGLGSPIA